MPKIPHETKEKQDFGQYGHLLGNDMGYLRKKPGFKPGFGPAFMLGVFTIQNRGWIDRLAGYIDLEMKMVAGGISGAAYVAQQLPGLHHHAVSNTFSAALHMAIHVHCLAIHRDLHADAIAPVGLGRNHAGRRRIDRRAGRSRDIQAAVEVIVFPS